MVQVLDVRVIDNHLNLGFRGFSRISSGLFKLQAIFYLRISKNQLTALPSEVGQLYALRWIELDSNQLTSVPESFARLVPLLGNVGQRKEIRRLLPSRGLFGCLPFSNNRNRS